MWYQDLRRDQHYLKSWRTHNLWLDHFYVKARMNRIQAFHIGLLMRMSKSISGVSNTL